MRHRQSDAVVIAVLSTGVVLGCLSISETVMGVAIVESALGYDQWRSVIGGLTTLNRLSVAYICAVASLIATKWSVDQ